MKKTIFIAMTTVVAGALALVGCVKTDNSTPTPVHVTPFDSTGVMTASIGGNAFTAYAITASKAGTLLSIVGTQYSGTTSTALSTINLHINYYYNADTTVNINLNDSTEFLGSAGYVSSGSSGGTATGYAHGQIRITNAGPQLTGTFFFTCVDSTKITGGTFTVKAP